MNARAFALLFFSVVTCAAPIPAPAHAATLQQPTWEIRVEPLEGGGEGATISVPGYGYVATASFSPDGEWIAFNAYERGAGQSPSEVWIARADGSDPQHVTEGATPRWSPDGERLIFKRDDFTNPQAESGIYVIHRDGTGEQFICEGRWPDWSPDGREIVFARGGEYSGGARIGSILYIARADGSRPEEIGEGDCPSFAPNNRALACCVRTGENEATIQIIDLENGERLTLGPGWLRPNWAPDSSGVVVNGGRPREHGHMVFYAAAPDSRPEPLFHDIEGSYEPCLSPDGRTLVFSVFLGEQ